MPVPYAGTIFLSSLLLFLVQPLIARLILPWFGGTAAVWTTCMLFFQSVLLAGYAYAHATTAKLGPRAQALLHTGLLIAAVALLPILPDPAWKPAGGDEPVSRILLLLAATVGLPYFLLSATSPLVQAWFARARPGTNPYRLFAVSNLASLLALVGYPFLIEPYFSNARQVSSWSWLFAAFAVSCGLLAWRAAGHRGARAMVAEPATAAPARGQIALWLGLSATGSVMLLAVTNHITQNIAAIPLLWLAPLTLYLLSFILCFEGRGLYRPRWMWFPTLAWLGGMAWLIFDPRHQHDLYIQLGAFLSGLFVACMFCHGELYLRRPANAHLTLFYLWVSLGGALGGLFVAVIAPLVFRNHHELAVGLSACSLFAAVLFRDLGRVALAASVATLLGVTGAVGYDALKSREFERLSTRSFYGVLTVKEYGAAGDAEHLRRLLHGTIMHGEQFMTGAARGEATTYYGRTSGIGRAIASRQAGPVRVGVIGLGVGTLAVYGRAGDSFRFYEINPEVVEIARRDFAYLGESKARIETVLGDARLSLEGETGRSFDVLAVDAFSSDSIPVHLLTKQALQVYFRHLKPDGIVAFHVSNRFLDLAPVVAALASDAGAHAVEVSEKGDERKSQSNWVLVSRAAAALERPEIESVSLPIIPERDWALWTDDYNNLLQVLR